MHRLIVFFLTVLFLLCSAFSLRAYETFHIVTEAPIPVGGGMIRYYQNLDNGYISVRYSYGGTFSNYILVDKVTRSSFNKSSKKELIKVPLEEYQGKRTGFLEVGSHSVQLDLNKYNRIVVRKLDS